MWCILSLHMSLQTKSNVHFKCPLWMVSLMAKFGFTVHTGLSGEEDVIWSVKMALSQCAVVR
jgi:hypothetical protein